MTDKERIKAEIERRKKEAYGNEWGWVVQCATYDEILSFINSLPEEPVNEKKLFKAGYIEGFEDGVRSVDDKEESVSEELEEAAEKWDNEIGKQLIQGRGVTGFKAGAQWQKN